MRETRPWAAVAAATCLNLPLGSIYAFSVLLVPLQQLLGASRSELTAVFSLSIVCFTVGMNLGPSLLKWLVAPWLLVIGTIGGAAGIALSALATSVGLLAVGYGLLFGIFGGIGYIGLQHGVNQVLKGSKGLVNGYMVSLYPMGAMIAAPLFGWMSQTLGIAATFWTLAVAIAVTGAAAAYLLYLARIPAQARASGSGVAAPAATTGRPLLFWQLFVVFLLAAAAGLTVLSQAAGIISAYGASGLAALLGTTVITGAIAAARLGGGWLVDKFAVPWVMAGAQALALTGAICLTLWPDPAVALPTLMMIGMGYGLISGATAGAIAFYWPPAVYGRISSRVYIAWSVAAITLPIVAGYLFDLTRDYKLAILLAGACNLVGLLAALSLPRQQRLA
jgi:MFS family permease